MVMAHWQQMNVGELRFGFASFAEVACETVFFFAGIPANPDGLSNWNFQVRS
jgi:hypothetical protein